MKLGKSRPFHELTMWDFLRHPIWQSALDEEDVEGQDESWVKPVLDSHDVTEDCMIITLTIPGTELLACGVYSDFIGRFPTIGSAHNTLSDKPKWHLDLYHLWQDGQVRDLGQIADLAYPLIFEAVPSIYGQAGVRFSCDSPKQGQLPRIN